MPGPDSAARAFEVGSTSTPVGFKHINSSLAGFKTLFYQVKITVVLLEFVGVAK